MPHFKKLTPNLLVGSIERSLTFYVDVLGFERGMTVPDESPLVFAQATNGPVEIFFNEISGAVAEYPVLADTPIGLSGTMFIEVERIDALHDELKHKTTIVKALVTQFYGMREFAIVDPDGYVITFAERV